MRNTSDLRARLMQRHGKRLHVPIDLGPPPTKKVCSDRGGEDPAPEVSTLVATRPDEDGPSASSAAPPDAAGPSAATMVQADTPGPGSHVVVDTPMSEGVPDEKSSRAAAVPPSREELMEMLKGVPCFTDAEARLLFGTSESVVPYSQPLQERTILETAEVVNTSLLFFSCFFSSYHFSIITLFVVLLLLCPGHSQHPQYDAHTRTSFQATVAGRGHACLHLPASGWCRGAARPVEEG